MSANQLVKPLKMETDSEIDLYQTEVKPDEDLLHSGGIAIEDANAYIRRNSNDMVFKDPNNSEYTLTQLAAAGSALDDVEAFAMIQGVL